MPPSWKETRKTDDPQNLSCGRQTVGKSALWFWTSCQYAGNLSSGKERGNPGMVFLLDLKAVIGNPI